jgi:Ca-activated chloride channel family protein
MKRLALDLAAIPLLALIATASVASGQVGELRVEIHRPVRDLLLPKLEPSIEVEGGASIFGGVRYLDLFLVLDTSKSLHKTDPKDYRVAGAVGLVKSLPSKSDIQVGVVDFDSNADLLAPLTSDRAKVVRTLRGLDRTGSTDLAAGIKAALSGFDQGARRGSSRVILLFTDGKSDEKEALQAMGEARRRGVAIHTLLLGSNEKGTQILRAIAKGAGGSFLRVTDPAKLPDAFLNLRTTGVEGVTLSANGSPPVAARLSGGTFTGRVPLQMGENRIVATATSLDGETRDASTTVIVSGPLSVGIDTPTDGTLYTERRVEAEVEGWATLFGQVPAERRASHTDHGIRRVVLRVGDSPPFATTLENGRFEGRVMLHQGENRILATATASDGRVADAAITVTVRPEGCGELEVKALRDGRPALSISDRAIEIVFDASGSMWGQLQGTSKMAIAKEILEGALGGLPDDLMVGLRVYGHQHPKEQRDCRDSELLVPLAQGNRGRIRAAIASFKPRGQTPLAYSLERVSEDFGDFQGERAAVLVTDGIESCGGDPVAAARSLQAGGSFPVHVIGFGLAGADDADLASLRAIADASGGKFLTAGSAEELRRALSVTVGTAYRVMRDGDQVADGTLGADDLILLPEGDYLVHVDSAPPHQVPVRLAAEENLTMLLQRDRGQVSQSERRRSAEYTSCADPLQATTVRRRPAAPAGPPASSPAYGR